MSFRRFSRKISGLADGIFAPPRRNRQRYNPNRVSEQRRQPERTVYTVFDYNGQLLREERVGSEEECKHFAQSNRITWINVDGLRKEEVERMAHYFQIHPLVVEDILNTGQRAKVDELGEGIFCLLPMLYYNENTAMVEAEQVSIVLGPRFVLSFQEDETRDVFDPVRERLRSGNAKLRNSGADYLCYSLIDVIVDSYFTIIEKLNSRVEVLEDLLLQPNQRKVPMARIALLRREVMVVIRALQPVRDLVNGFVRSENGLLDEGNKRYFKDVLDHIIQANEYADNLRDMVTNLQDLSMNQVNLRTNEVMKTFTIITVLLAPATVIGGIFGMNFDVIPLTHHREGFYVLVSMMFIIPLLMLIWFKRKGWF